MMGNRGTENQNTRMVWLDVMKYICIIMVMFSHLQVVTDICL